MLPDSEIVVKKFVKDYGWKGRVFSISAISGIGCKELTYAIMQHIEENKHLADDVLAAKKLNDAGLINESAATKAVTEKDV